MCDARRCMINDCPKILHDSLQDGKSIINFTTICIVVQNHCTLYGRHNIKCATIVLNIIAIIQFRHYITIMFKSNSHTVIVTYKTPTIPQLPSRRLTPPSHTSSPLLPAQVQSALLVRSPRTVVREASSLFVVLHHPSIQRELPPQRHHLRFKSVSK